MKVKVVFYFSFSTSRIRYTNNATNIKGITHESSINSRFEAYTINEEYTTKNEIHFRKRIEWHLNKFVRKNPSITKCTFECDLVPNCQVALSDEFNRKLTNEHVKNLSKEIALKARRRYKNPNAFKG